MSYTQIQRLSPVCGPTPGEYSGTHRFLSLKRSVGCHSKNPFNENGLRRKTISPLIEMDELSLNCIKLNMKRLHKSNTCREYRFYKINELFISGSLIQE